MSAAYWVLSNCNGALVMSISTSLLAILYIRVSRNAALRFSKLFHPKLLIMVTLDSLL